jgi:hypothetical protein
VQNPQTAQFAAMPASIAPPLVDGTAELEGIGPLLHDLLTDAYAPAAPTENRALRALLDQLRQASGIDFAQYKASTIQRRLERRMATTGLRRLSEYREYVQTHPEEYERLVSTFLIKVTEFFRGPNLFTYLREQILPEIVASARGRDQEIRLWSAGCALSCWHSRASRSPQASGSPTPWAMGSTAWHTRRRGGSFRTHPADSMVASRTCVECSGGAGIGASGRVVVKLGRVRASGYLTLRTVSGAPQPENITRTS